MKFKNDMRVSTSYTMPLRQSRASGQEEATEGTAANAGEAARGEAQEGGQVEDLHPALHCRWKGGRAMDEEQEREEITWKKRKFGRIPDVDTSLLLHFPLVSPIPCSLVFQMPGSLLL